MSRVPFQHYLQDCYDIGSKFSLVFNLKCQCLHNNFSELTICFFVGQLWLRKQQVHLVIGSRLCRSALEPGTEYGTAPDEQVDSVHGRTVWLCTLPLRILFDCTITLPETIPLPFQKSIESRKARLKRRQKHTWISSQQRTSNLRNECSYLLNSTRRWAAPWFSSSSPLSSFFCPTVNPLDLIYSAAVFQLHKAMGLLWVSNYSSQPRSLSSRVQLQPILACCKI